MRARRVFCLLLAVILLAALLPQALAAGLIETDRPVTLTVRFFHDKAPVSGAPFSLYRVADVSAYGEFTLTGDFKDDPVRLDNRNSDGWRALAETLRAFVLRDSRKPLDTGVTGSTGLLTFPNRQKTLRPGLYLLLGESFVSGGYSYTVEPSLICLPCADETSNTWDYDAALAPKHDREPLPPAPSDDTVERKVLKVWDDGNAASRPQEITVQLLKDGVVYDTVRLNAKKQLALHLVEAAEIRRERPPHHLDRHGDGRRRLHRLHPAGGRHLRRDELENAVHARAAVHARRAVAAADGHGLVAGRAAGCLRRGAGAGRAALREGKARCVSGRSS